MSKDWYQNKSDLLAGKTPSLYQPIEKVLSRIVKGKNVLDMGCNAGVVSLVASKCGAGRVMGIDFKQKYIDQANKVKQIWERMYGLRDVKFKQYNIVEYPNIINDFNFFIFIRVLYHIRCGEDKTPNNIQLGIELVFNKIRQTKYPIILLQGNPGRYKYVKPKEGLYGSNGQMLATIDGMKELLGSFGFRSIVLPDEIVIGVHKDVPYDKVKKFAKCLKK